MKVAIGIPAYSDVRYRTVRSLMSLASLLTAHGIIYDEPVHAGDPDLARARNAIMAAFLAGDADRLLFVDTDVNFAAADAWRLLNSGADYIGANYPRKSLGGGWASTPKENGLVCNSLVEADMLATGLLCLSRAAVAKLSDASPIYVADDGRAARAIAFGGVLDGRWVSEDEAMCRRWQALGGVAWIDTSVQCHHVGLMTFTEQTA